MSGCACVSERVRERASLVDMVQVCGCVCAHEEETSKFFILKRVNVCAFLCVWGASAGGCVHMRVCAFEALCFLVAENDDVIMNLVVLE